MTTTPDVRSFVAALEGRDADSVLAWYADDATITTVDRDHPPSSPQVLRGRDAIGEQLRDVCSRDMTHEIRDVVVTSEAIAFTEHCRYADGTKVLCVAMAALADGRIVAQTGVQAWDD